MDTYLDMAKPKHQRPSPGRDSERHSVGRLPGEDFRPQQQLAMASSYLARSRGPQARELCLTGQRPWTGVCLRSPRKRTSYPTNRPSDRGAELVAAESRNGGWIEEIARVQGAVPEELVCAPVKAVCSRARNCVDHSAGGLPVFSGKVAGQNGELLHGVHAQITAQHAAGPAVGVIVEADAVESLIVLRGPCTRDNYLRSKAAVTSSAISESHLCLDASDPGLQAGKIR